MIEELSLQEFMEITQAEGLLTKAFGGDMLELSSAGPRKPIDESARTAWLTFSTNDIDRFKHRLDPKGAVLTNYAACPLFLWNHGKSRPLEDSVIGKTLRVDRYADRLEALVKYESLPSNPLPDKIWDLEQRGLIPAQSIGWRPLADIKIDRATGETSVGKWELLEISKVAIPVNGKAVRFQ